MIEIFRRLVPETFREKRKRYLTKKRIQKNKTLTLQEKKKRISKLYKKNIGYTLDWENPLRYTEKINISKLLCPTAEKTKLSDKYLVRDWVEEIIGSEYLIPCLGVYDSFEQIDFETLPEKFVLKCNHDTGSVVFCDKSIGINKKKLKKRFEFNLATNLADINFEMHYKNISPKIIAEKFMGDSINDYKFMCMNGEPYYCRVDANRFTDHRRNIYDMEWNLQPFNEGEYPNSSTPIKKPKEFDLMKNLVVKLCAGFDCVRVDMYEIDGKVYFGEMTFTSGNGMERILPDEYDFCLGKLWNLSIK